MKFPRSPNWFSWVSGIISEEEFNYIQNSNHRVVTYFDRDIKEKLFEGQTLAFYRG